MAAFNVEPQRINELQLPFLVDYLKRMSSMLMIVITMLDFVYVYPCSFAQTRKCLKDHCRPKFLPIFRVMICLIRWCRQMIECLYLYRSEKSQTRETKCQNLNEKTTTKGRLSMFVICFHCGRSWYFVMISYLEN